MGRHSKYYIRTNSGEPKHEREKAKCVVHDEGIDALLDEVYSKYHYRRDQLWIPIDDEDFREDVDFDYFFIMDYYAKPYLKSIIDVLFLKDQCIYFIPLNDTDYTNAKAFCFTRSEFERFRNDYAEYFCVPENLEWAFYRCHEEVFTFAGALVGRAKRITEPVKQYWNEYYGA